MDVVDARLVGGVRLSLQRRAAFDAGAGAGPHEHEAWQVSSIQALLDGRYDGELVVLDGRCFQVRADGTVLEPDPTTTRTPFAVVCRFAPGAPVRVDGPLGLPGLTAVLDDLAAPSGEPVVAVRVDGSFADVHLRSVPRQSPPYPPLSAVVEHQVTWSVPEVRGTVVGFRFPAALQGVEVPGYHLHLLSDDRTVGGHVVSLTVHDALARVDGAHDLHVEVPPGVDVLAVDGSAAGAEAIRRVEGG
jgi:acetolactate decarboxylase